jgi:hypothetical protein
MVVAEEQSLSERFAAADRSGFVEFAALADDLDRVLWVQHVAAAQLDEEVLSPHEISLILRDVMRYEISRQQVEALLSSSRGMVSPRRRKKKRVYQIMQAGIDHVEGTRESVLFIEPEKALTRTRELQELIGTKAGILKICDPYLAPRSLDLLTGLPSAREVRILTDHVDKPDIVRRDAKTLAKELGVPVEVRRAPSRVLHDRYIIDDTSMVMLGTSLNGIGSKQSMIVTVGQDLRGMADAAFDGIWKGAPQL